MKTQSFCPPNEEIKKKMLKKLIKTDQFRPFHDTNESMMLINAINQCICLNVFVCEIAAFSF